jgi:hypothetical protein
MVGAQGAFDQSRLPRKTFASAGNATVRPNDVEKVKILPARRLETSARMPGKPALADANRAALMLS